MLKLDKQKHFDWDKGNVDKSYLKHGVFPNQAEEAFLDGKAIILRYLLIGQISSKKILLVAFTIRENKIRIISARPANKKEIKHYA